MRVDYLSTNYSQQMFNKIVTQEIEGLVKRALAEDIGEGDITTKILFPEKQKVKAVILAKEKGIIAGLPIAKLVFKMVDKKISFIPQVREGEGIRSNQIVAKLSGNCDSLLAGERGALNFLSHLSGIASLTNLFVKKVKNRVKIMDTRKTIPNLRLLEKYAVRIGGGKNHRFGLFDGILIKDNHIKVKSDEVVASRRRSNPTKSLRAIAKQSHEIATSSPLLSCESKKGGLLAMTPQFKIKAIKNLIAKAKKETGKMKVEVEVENYQEAKVAMKAGADIIMLDNIGPEKIKKIIKFARNLPEKPIFEVSGGITLSNINQFASLGIDRISIGSLTHSAPALDLAMNIL